MSSSRSLLAFWLGGSVSGPAQNHALRSLLAPWVGGAASAPAPEAAHGVHSLLAFWMGGARGDPRVTVSPGGAGGASLRHPIGPYKAGRPGLASDERAGKRKSTPADDDILIFLLR